MAKKQQSKERSGKTAFLLRWLAMVPLGGIWFIFTFLMAGYSFTALVCAVLIGILLFYNICYLTKNKFPKLTRVVKRVFTLLLVLGLLVVGCQGEYFLCAAPINLSGADGAPCRALLIEK